MNKIATVQVIDVSIIKLFEEELLCTRRQNVKWGSEMQPERERKENERRGGRWGTWKDKQGNLPKK